MAVCDAERTCHFNCEWRKVRGGERPVAPPSVFPGITKSCFKQTVSKPRSTSATSDKRAETEAKRREAEDKIKDFEEFCREIRVRFSANFNVITDDGGRDVYKVIRFLHLRSVTSHFGLLHFVTRERDGITVS